MKLHASKTSLLTALLAFLGVCAHAQEATEPFVLEGYELFSAPRLLTTGRFDEIIARDGRRLVSARIDAATSTNLCVAYIKTSRFAEARTACDTAIAAALAGRMPEAARWPHSGQERWNDVARSYSNRAVLNWYSGARAAAETDLAKAAAYAPQAHFVLRNTAALQARGVDVAAIVAHAGA